MFSHIEFNEIASLFFFPESLWTDYIEQEMSSWQKLIESYSNNRFYNLVIFYEDLLTNRGFDIWVRAVTKFLGFEIDADRMECVKKYRTEKFFPEIKAREVNFANVFFY